MNITPPKSILLVEDMESNASLFRTMLERMEYTCQTAASGQEALSLLGAQPFDLTLLDIRLPDISGLEVARLIREELHIDNARMPIIALTAGPEPEQMSSYFEAGIDDFLQKPLQRATLEKMLGNWLSGGMYDDDPFVSGFDYQYADPPDLDIDALQSFLGHMGKEKLTAAVGQFKTDCLARIKTLHDKPDGNAEDIQGTLHALIATSASMGLMKLSLYCRETMDKSHLGEYVNNKDVAEGLSARYSASIGKLESYIESL